MLKRRIRTLAVTGITIVAAIVFTTPSATGVLTASRAPAAGHVKGASAAPAPAPAHGVLHVISNGLAKDCVEIELGSTGWQIWDNGPYKAVSLVKAPGSCWNLHGPVYVWYAGSSQLYVGYVYQDLRGDCLWDDGSFILTAPGPTCSESKNYEVFFGIHYYSALGWTFTDAYYGPSNYMTFVDAYDYVRILPPPITAESLWNFP
jgi:hypothetical protein